MKANCSCRGCGKLHNGKRCVGCATTLIDPPGPNCDKLYHTIVKDLSTNGTTCGCCGVYLPPNRIKGHRCKKD